MGGLPWTRGYLLGAFGVLWFVQVVGTALQMRHYRRVLAESPAPGRTASWASAMLGRSWARA